MWQFYFSPPVTDAVTASPSPRRAASTRYTITREAHRDASPGRHGEIDTERWHRRSDDGKTEAYVWLAPSLHYIPVKMRVVQHRPRHARGAARLDPRRRAEARRRSNDACAANQVARPRRRDRRRSAPLAGTRRRAARTSFFRAHPAIGPRDRAFVAEGVFALPAPTPLDRSARRDDRSRASSRWPSLVRELGHSVRELERVAPRRRRAVAARVQGAPRTTTLPPRRRADLPDWLWERLGAAYGDDDARGARARAGSRRRRSTCASTR